MFFLLNAALLLNCVSATSRFQDEVLNAKNYIANIATTGLKPKFCCNDYYIEPTEVLDPQYGNYTKLHTETQKTSCASSTQTDKCGNIVPTRNTHLYGSGGIHCIESHSCLDCIEHFQILCGPGYTWDDSSQMCTWKIDIPHAMAYDQGHDILGSHGDVSCIILDPNGYALVEAGVSAECFDINVKSNRCYSAFHNVDMGGLPSTMVGKHELDDMGLDWEGVTPAPHEENVVPSRSPTEAQSPTVSRAPSPPPTPLPDRYSTTHMNYDTLSHLLMNGFCCSRFFEEGIIGGAKEIFKEGKEFLPGTDTDTQMINMGIADGSLALGRRRLAYTAGEIPTFSELFFGGHKACGHNPPVDTKCGRVVDPHGLPLQHVDMTEYLGTSHCGDSGGRNQCHDKVKTSIATFSDELIPAGFCDNPGGCTYQGTLDFYETITNSDALDLAINTHYKAYIEGCAAEEGCGFHSDCTSECYPDAKRVYDSPSGCGSCTGTGGSTTCVVNSAYYEECVENLVEPWEPVPSLCTSTSTYESPVPGTFDLSGNKVPNACPSYPGEDPFSDFCGDEGDPFLSRLFTHTDGKTVATNCMCSVDGRPKADKAHQPCFMCLDANVIACADQYSYNIGADKCMPDGVCANFEDECHVQPEDQLYADPTPCLAKSGHNVAFGEDPVATDRAQCEGTNYTVPRACVWDRKVNKCKAGIYFGSYNAEFQQKCANVNLEKYRTSSGMISVGAVQMEWDCESTLWNETRPCQATDRVAYPVKCTRLHGTGTIDCDPARRQIPWSPDPDDICDVLLGRKNASFMGKNYNDTQVMEALGHLCDLPTPPKESTTHKFIDWVEGLNTMELVAFVFLMIPVVGTLACTGNAVFKWNTGCCKACCGKRGRKNIKRLPVTPVIKSNTVPASTIIGGPHFRKAALV